MSFEIVSGLLSTNQTRGSEDECSPPRSPVSGPSGRTLPSTSLAVARLPNEQNLLVFSLHCSLDGLKRVESDAELK